jgi:LuxR family maltose regulon positive regulatory protein
MARSRGRCLSAARRRAPTSCGRGDWPDAEERAGQAIDLIETAGIQEHVLSILGFAAAARVAAHHGDQVAARRHVGRTLRLYATPSPAAFPWLSAQVAITLGEILLDLGDHAAARFRAEEARGHLAGLLTEGVLRQQLHRVTGRLAREGGHLRVPSAMTLSKLSGAKRCRTSRVAG